MSSPSISTCGSNNIPNVDALTFSFTFSHSSVCIRLLFVLESIGESVEVEENNKLDLGDKIWLNELDKRGSCPSLS